MEVVLGERVSPGGTGSGDADATVGEETGATVALGYKVEAALGECVLSGTMGSQLANATVGGEAGATVTTGVRQLPLVRKQAQ